MHIVAIGWAYVILMMAVTANNVGKALAILLLLGVLPIALFAYVVDGPRRRQRSMAMADQAADQRDAADAHSD